MIMAVDYRDEVISRIKETPADVFGGEEKKKEILENHDTIETLWYHYQKNVSEYGCEEEWSFYDALNECLGIYYSPVLSA